MCIVYPNVDSSSFITIHSIWSMFQIFIFVLNEIIWWSWPFCITIKYLFKCVVHVILNPFICESIKKFHSSEVVEIHSIVVGRINRIHLLPFHVELILLHFSVFFRCPITFSSEYWIVNWRKNDKVSTEQCSVNTLNGAQILSISVSTTGFYQ